MIPILSTRVHGVVDYVTAVYLMIFPWVVGFSNYSWSPWVLMVIGIALLIYSLLTRYEAGYVGLISMRTHLVLDALFGALLIASPWLLGFTDRWYWPHVLGGCVLVALALFTKTRASHANGPLLKADNSVKASDEGITDMSDERPGRFRREKLRSS